MYSYHIPFSSFLVIVKARVKIDRSSMICHKLVLENSILICQARYLRIEGIYFSTQKLSRSIPEWFRYTLKNGKHWLRESGDRWLWFGVTKRMVIRHNWSVYQKPLESNTKITVGFNKSGHFVNKISFSFGYYLEKLAHFSFYFFGGWVFLLLILMPIRTFTMASMYA